MRRWYAVSTHLRGEDKAQFNLRRQGYQVFCPKYLKRRNHARKFDWVAAPLFPGYVFIALNLEVDQWHAVRSTFGVSHFICHGDLPAPVPNGIVESLQATENSEGFIHLNFARRIEAGENIKVVHGALADQIGVFDCVDDDQRVFILLEIMGRQVRVRLPAEAIAAHG